jgi:hypothetical protein
MDGGRAAVPPGSATAGGRSGAAQLVPLVPASFEASSGAEVDSPDVLASFCRRFCSCFCSFFFFLASSRWRFSNE